MGGDDVEMASAYASGAVDFIFTPVLPDVLRAKVTAFVDLFLQSQELQRSLESITALNAALRDSDVRTQAVLDNVADGIFILDEDGLIESVNRSVGQLFGYHDDEPVGQPFAFMIAPEHRDEFSRPATARSASADGAAASPRGRSRQSAAARTARSSRWSWSAARCKHGERHVHARLRA